MALWRVRATVDDRPGFLAVLTASLALKAINILAVQVHTTEAGAVDDFLVDAPDQLTEAELIAAVERGRGRDAWVSRADAHGLVDPPAQALGLAARLVQDPETLGAVLAAMVDGSVTWRPAPGTPGFGFVGATMRLPDPAGGCYVVTREAPAFTPAEYARAQALADLAVAAGRQAIARATLLLADGTEVTVRLAGAEDVEAVQAMHERCSPTTRYRRYLSGSAGPTAVQLGRLLTPARGAALVAEVETADGDRLVAVANLIGEGDVAEVAVLVEDAWQRRGIGTALVRRLVTMAGQTGYAALVLHTLAENSPMLHTLERLGRECAHDLDGSMLTVTLPLHESGTTPPVLSPPVTADPAPVTPDQT
jgi:GNAT superfamily N-acetyltransferase